MKVICFDIEATDNGEILELSVFNYPAKKEIYHSYFKPEKAKEWRNTEQIHHITPLMVADAPRFKSDRKRIQKLIDSADIIVGFAVDNDLRYLYNSGINFKEKIPVLDVRDLFWVVKGKECGLEFGNVPKLTKCAELVGMDFAEETDAHSATNDTLATLRLMEHLLKDYNNAKVDVALCTAIRKKLEADHEEVMERNAKGVIRLQPTEGGYRIKNNRWIEDEIPSADPDEYIIKVNSRFLAEHDIRTMFSRRASKIKPAVYLLRKADIDKFLAYTNTYNAVQELLYRNRYGYKRTKNQFDFRIG